MPQSMQGPAERTPGLSPPSSALERRQLLDTVRGDIQNIRAQLRLAEAEERFLRLHLELFPSDESVGESVGESESDSWFESPVESESDPSI